MAKDVVALICDGASVNQAVARQLQKEDWRLDTVLRGTWHSFGCIRPIVLVTNCSR